MFDPEDWLLQFSSQRYGWAAPLAYPNGDGRPWGDGTYLAARELAQKDPWDTGCKVTTFVGGLAVMHDMRETLESVLTWAQGRTDLPNDNTHVYIAGWRFNPQRDLSEDNPWGTDKWANEKPIKDQTAMGLVLRLMAAGVQVRLLLWYPQYVTEAGSGQAHPEDHAWAAAIVRAYDQALRSKGKFAGLKTPLGVVLLDLRVADIPAIPAGSHHQKLLIIRSGAADVTYCGGVDLAFTRRDAPPAGGDWQSGKNIPRPGDWWPGADQYDALKNLHTPKDAQDPDLPPEVFEDRQSWHDQHLRLEGPIVQTFEEQFRERWHDSCTVNLLSEHEDPSHRSHRYYSGYVIASTPDATEKKNGRVDLRELPPGEDITASPGKSIAQMWRTMPWRTSRTRPPFERAEFTAMAGIANAVSCAQKLILIFDQYFWSLPLARLLNYRLEQASNLHIIVVLPPHADGANINRGRWSAQTSQHRARARALDILTKDTAQATGRSPRVAVYDMWHPPASSDPNDKGWGFYVHAKAQTYDGALLVCGSCNLNRRSFTCDSESVCAVLDANVVHGHQKTLWATLFPDVAWPKNTDGAELDFSLDNDGASFFHAFQQAAEPKGSFLIADLWHTPPFQLPKGGVREQQAHAWSANRLYSIALDPLALPVNVEGDVCKSCQGDPGAAGRLDEVVFLLESCWHTAPDGKAYWPFRTGPVGTKPWDKFAHENLLSPHLPGSQASSATSDGQKPATAERRRNRSRWKRDRGT